MRRSLLSVAGGLAVLAACSSSTSPGGCTPTATQVCMVGGNASPAFNPVTLTITHGTTVTWSDGDGIVHTVKNSTSSTEVFSSSASCGAGIAAGGTYSHTFNTAGTYNYYCQCHGSDGTPPTGMHGTIVVN
jgi:plastocyanin